MQRDREDRECEVHSEECDEDGEVALGKRRQHSVLAGRQSDPEAERENGDDDCRRAPTGCDVSRWSIQRLVNDSPVSSSAASALRQIATRNYSSVSARTIRGANNESRTRRSSNPCPIPNAKTATATEITQRGTAGTFGPKTSTNTMFTTIAGGMHHQSWMASPRTFSWSRGNQTKHPRRMCNDVCSTSPVGHRTHMRGHVMKKIIILVILAALGVIAAKVIKARQSY